MKKIKLLIIGIVILLGFFLRYKNYASVPHPGESLDEYSTTWVGMSLLEMGYPVGGLGVGGYINKIYEYINPDFVYQTGVYANPIVINYPWFDHPPMGGIVMGGWSLINGVNTFANVSVRDVRQPMIIFGVLSVLLVIWLGWLMFDYLTGVIAGIIYTVSPMVVVGSRMGQIENMLIPLFLFGVILTMYYLKNKDLRILILMGVVAGVALWFKLIGVVVLIVMLSLVGNKEKKILLGLYLPFVLGYFIYGLVTDFGVFKNVFMANSGRFYGIGPQAVFEMFTKFKFSNTRGLTDGWLVAGWLATLVVVVKEKQSRPILVSVITFVGLYLIFGNYSYGWYLLPLWPWLFLGLARLIRLGIKGENLESLFLILIAPLGVGIMKFMSLEKFQSFVNYWRLLIGGGLIGTILMRNSLLVRLLIFFMFVTAVCLSVDFVWKLDVQKWFEIS